MEDDERDEVNRLSNGVEVGEFGFGVAVEARRVLFEDEPHGLDGDAGVAPVVEEVHGVRTDGLHDTDEEVGLRVNLEIDEMVLFHVPRLLREEVEFFLFHDEGEGEEEVGKDTDDDHEEGGEREGYAEEDVEEDGPDFGPGACGKEVGDDLLQVLEDEAAEADAGYDGFKSALK